jgi:hypothetical protein
MKIKKNKKIDSVMLFLEKLLKQFNDELRDLLPVDNNGGRFPDEDVDRISDLKSMIKVVEDIIEYIQTDEKEEIK